MGNKNSGRKKSGVNTVPWSIRVPEEVHEYLTLNSAEVKEMLIRLATGANRDNLET